MIRIMLDAGHYGKFNQSPCDPAYFESDMTWKLTNYLRDELKEYGFSVGVTRSDKDKDLDVYARGQCAKGRSMFISLHSNAASSSVMNGVDRPVIIYPIKDSSAQRAFADKLGALVRDVMGTGQKHQIMTREYPGRPDLDYYGVIRGAVAAGCKDSYIVEHGFHTDSYCTAWLLNDTNLRKLATAEAKLIAEHYGYKKEEPATPSVDSSAKKSYRIEGSFPKKADAEKFLAELKAKGFNGKVIEN